MTYVASQILLYAGIPLLAVAALSGFMPARLAPNTPEHAHWRVVHNGGTAGAVQLIALSAVFREGPNPTVFTTIVFSAIALATWAFFVGPLLRALDRERAARRVNLAGAFVAAPAYVLLPAVLV